MKKIYCLLAGLCIGFSALAQDEGHIAKRERFERDNGVFLGLGPSFTLGKNIGDYSTGLNIEVGYTKRLNRVISIGPSFSFLKFKYDAEKTGINNIFVEPDLEPGNSFNYWPAVYVNFDGGDMSLYSLALTIKLNLLPVTDDSKISVYGFAKPFVTAVSRTKVSGDAYIFAIPDLDYSGDFDEYEVLTGAEYYRADEPWKWEAASPDWQDYGVTISNDLNKDSRITGGIFIGPGIELMPVKVVSIYAQAAFGYTFPVTFVSTKKYEGNNLDTLDEKYPIAKEGFPSVNLQFGVSFNF